MALTPSQVVERARKQLSELISRKVSGVLGVTHDEEGWHVKLEMLEREAIPSHMDLLATYECLLDEEGNIVKFDRGDLRTRGEATKYEE